MIPTPNFQASLRDAVNNDVWVNLVGSGVPTSGANGTGTPFAGKGSTYCDYTNGAEYFNFGTKTVPSWVLVTSLAIPTTVFVTLTNAQIKALRATPITLVAAPGAGKYVVPISCFVELVFGTNAFTAQANDNLGLKWKDGTTTAICTGGVQAWVQAAASAFTNMVDAAANSSINVAKTSVDNQPLVIHNITGAEIAGNAANDNTMRVNLTYAIQTSV